MATVNVNWDDVPVPRLLGAMQDAQADGDEEVARFFAEILDRRLRFTPDRHQRPPEGDWSLWLLLGGRGSGKTGASAYETNLHALGPPCDPNVPGGHRMGIVGPTFGDTIDSCYYSPAGLSRINPQTRLRTLRGGITVVEWPNGATARIFGAYTEQDTERLRAGGNRCFDWWEELAAWRELQRAYDQAIFGLRLGLAPRAVASTTPKNRPLIHELARSAQRKAAGEPSANRKDEVVITKATTHDNPHLDPAIRADLYARYSGTRLGEQELEGILLDDLGTRFTRSDFGIRDDAPAWPTRIRSWDLAGTEPGPANPDPDWTSGARLAIEAGALGLWNVDDLVHVRRSAAEVESLVIATAILDGPDTIVLIEQEGGQAGKAQIAHFQRVLRGIAKRVVGFAPTGPKESRAELVERASQQGRVTLTRGNWNLAFLDEHEAFPDGDHDDIVDSVSQAFVWLEAGAAAGPAKVASVANRHLSIALR